jgi:hypothetical protein
MSGVIDRFPLLLPVRNPVAGYGASAVMLQLRSVESYARELENLRANGRSESLERVTRSSQSVSIAWKTILFEQKT